MDLQLSEKRALVTESTGGIGEAIAKALAADGVFVVVHGRNKAEAARVSLDIRRNGGQAAVVIADMSESDAADQVAEQSIEAFEGIDILVNNAGFFPRESWFEASFSVGSPLFRVDGGALNFGY